MRTFLFIKINTYQLRQHREINTLHSEGHINSLLSSTIVGHTSVGASIFRSINRNIKHIINTERP